jgi:hypothetical protein
MQISSSTRAIALGTAAGLSIALSGTALAVAVGGDRGNDHGGGSGPPAFAAHQQDNGRDGQMQLGPDAQQGYSDQQSSPTGPPMQSGTS